MRWWRFVVASELRKILAFRVDFWVTFLGQILIQVVIARALWQNIFQESGKEVMEGYTLSSMTLYYLIAPVGTRILTGENIGFLSREIYDGTFNRYLVYPISFFQYKSLSYLTHSSFYAFQLCLIYCLYQLFNGQVIEVSSLLSGLVLFSLAAFAYAMIAIFIELIALWAENIWSLMVLTRFFCFFLGGALVPLSFFPTSMQKILSFTPFPYFLSLPIRTIMGQSSSTEVLTGMVVLILWGFFFRLMAKLLWNRGQYSYTGVGI